MNYNNFWDNVLKQEEWNDELKRWENSSPDNRRKILNRNYNKTNDHHS